MFAITSIYAGLLGLLFVSLSYLVTVSRRSQLVSIGDDGDRRLKHRIRAQGNCAEYAPIGLLLIALTEAQGAPGIAVHLLGLTLLAGRVLHAVAFLGTRMNIPVRIAGMVLTFSALFFSSAGLLLHGLF